MEIQGVDKTTSTVKCVTAIYGLQRLFKNL